MTDVGLLQSNIAAVRERISLAAERRAQATGSLPVVTLVAATKTVPADIVQSLIDSGVCEVGENRVQELVSKYDAVQGAKWHFIGTLQTNKAKYLVGRVALIQSVSGRALAQEISRLAERHGVIQDVLIELNAGGEQSKTGALPSEVDELIEYARSQSNLRVRGLMAIPPIGADDGIYRSARKVFDRHADGEFNIFSMGMSGDYEKAIINGSNMVRVGTALFGARRTEVKNNGE